METKIQKPAVTVLDIRIAVAVALCILISTLLRQLGITFSYENMDLEIIQKMTACIACLLCCQDNLHSSRKAGINRIIITFIGGSMGIFAVILDVLVGNQWFFIMLAFLGLIGTLYFCKLARVPYINARIGGVTFILVTCTLSQTARIWYAVFRFLSTILGVLVVLFITWLFSKFRRKRYV